MNKGMEKEKTDDLPREVVLTAESQQLICLVIIMGKTSPTFKQRDLTRAYRAVEAAGGQVARIEIEGSKVVLIPGNPESTESANPWDKALNEKSALR